MRRGLAVPFISVFLPLIFLAGAVQAQEAPQEVGICDLANNPKSFDAKMIRVRGSLSVQFEDFSLVGGKCDKEQGIWLAFGGDVPGIVASTVNDSYRKRGLDIKVNGVSYGIKKDENFRRLYALIAARHGNKPAFRVTATLTGAFFAGEERKLPNGRVDFAGYGHLGCCALLVITQVSDVESIPQANLNIRGIVVGPDGRPVKGLTVFDDILGGSPPERQQTVTDDGGNFAFSISGQLLRLETSEYRPVALSVEPGGPPIRVRLEEAHQSDWTIPSCGDTLGRVGFSVLFSVPPAMESSHMDDDFLHAYFIFPRGSELSSANLIVSTNATEQPGDDSAVDSSWSQQRWIKDSHGAIVGIDARGSRRQGGPWRSAQFFGRDHIGYGWLRGKPTRPLDSIIDSGCIARQ